MKWSYKMVGYTLNKSFWMICFWINLIVAQRVEAGTNSQWCKCCWWHLTVRIHFIIYDWLAKTGWYYRPPGYTIVGKVQKSKFLFKWFQLQELLNNFNIIIGVNDARKKHDFKKTTTSFLPWSHLFACCKTWQNIHCFWNSQFVKLLLS